MTEIIIPVIWLGLLATGLIITLLNLINSIEDRRYVYRIWPDHRARKLVADMSVRNQIILTAIMVLFILAGVVALLVPTPRSGIFAGVVLGGLISGVFLLVVLSVLERRDRRELIDRN